MRNKLIVFGYCLFFLFLNYGISVGQEDPESTQVIRNRIQSSEAGVRRLRDLINSYSLLETSDDQKTELKKLISVLNSNPMVRSWRSTTSVEKLKSYEKTLLEFREKVQTELLLPHQLEILERLELQSMLANSRSLWSKMALNYQQENLELSAKQIEKIKKISEDSLERINQLQKEYVDSYQPVAEENKALYFKVLTAEQLEIIRSYSTSNR